MADETNPLMTIGITCYREGEWLRECWRSVLAQTDDRWEAVLVMDGGADSATQKIFDEIEHPRLRKFRFERNAGPYPARNKAFEMTRTPYHFYVDGDDMLMSDTVGLALRGFEECPSAAVVLGDLECFGKYSRVLTYPREFTWDAFADLFASTDFGGVGAYRKSIWARLGGYAEEVHQGPADQDFLACVVEAGYQIVHAGKIIYRCRTREGSISQVTGRAKRAWEFSEIIARRHPKILAQERRLRTFLGHGYNLSVIAHLRAGELAEAKAVARKALARGCAGGLFTRVGVLAKAPIPVFVVLAQLWRLRPLGRFLRRLPRKIRPGAGNDHVVPRRGGVRDV